MTEEKLFTYYEVLAGLERGIYMEHGHNGKLRDGIYPLDAQRALSKAFREARRESGDNWREMKVHGELTSYPLETVAEVFDQLASQATSPINRTRNTVNRGGVNARVLMIAEQGLTTRFKG